MKINLLGKGCFGKDSKIRVFFNNRYFVIAFCSVLVITGVILYALTVKAVTVSLDGQRLRLRTTAPNVQAVMARHGLVLSADDRVLPSLKAKVTEGMEIKVERGVSLLLSVDGEELSLRTAPEKLGEVLAKAGVTLGPLDKTSLRSEEHTSELQSRPHLVCRLLLEKKKKKKKTQDYGRK